MLLIFCMRACSVCVSNADVCQIVRISSEDHEETMPYRLVEEKQWRIFQDQSRNCESLFFATLDLISGIVMRM